MCRCAIIKNDFLLILSGVRLRNMSFYLMLLLPKCSFNCVMKMSLSVWYDRQDANISLLGIFYKDPFCRFVFYSNDWFYDDHEAFCSYKKSCIFSKLQLICLFYSHPNYRKTEKERKSPLANVSMVKGKIEKLFLGWSISPGS